MPLYWKLFWSFLCFLLLFQISINQLISELILSKLEPNKAFLYEVVRVWAMKLIKCENIWQFEKKTFCFPTQFFGRKSIVLPVQPTKASNIGEVWQQRTKQQPIKMFLLKFQLFLLCSRIQFRKCPPSKYGAFANLLCKVYLFVLNFKSLKLLSFKLFTLIGLIDVHIDHIDHIPLEWGFLAKSTAWALSLQSIRRTADLILFCPPCISCVVNMGICR